MTTRSIIIAAGLTVAAAPRAGADAGGGAITEGEADPGDLGVVALVAAGHAMCTGTLIAPRVVLTAAHCVHVDPVVFFGSSLSEGGTSIDVAEARTHPGFQPDTLAHDVGLLLLVEPAPIGATPWPLAVELDAGAVGAEVRLVGFGHSAATGDVEHFKRQGTARIESYDERILRLAPSPSQTCHGDSGGPAFLSRDLVEYVVGITSYGDPACASFGVDVRVDRYARDLVQPYLDAIAAGSGPGGPAGAACAIDRLGLDCAAQLVCAVDPDQDQGDAICAEPCLFDAPGACADGFECTRVVVDADGDQRLACMPRPTSAGCTAGSGRPGIVLALFALAAIIRRSRTCAASGGSSCGRARPPRRRG